MEFNKLQCKICGKEFKHLGSHIWHKHKVLAREYKEEYGLPYKMSLITDEIKEKKSEKAKWQDTWKSNFKHSQQYQFTKGHTGQRRISQHERKLQLERIQKFNEERVPEECPVCHIIFDHLDSHLHTKHRLLRIKEDML